MDDAERLPGAAWLERVATEPEAFGVFYRRQVRAVLALLLARTRRADLAADLRATASASRRPAATPPSV